MTVVWTCRRALQLRLNDYLVVGPSIVTDLHGMSDSMVAELFESVRLFPCSADCAASLESPSCGDRLHGALCITHRTRQSEVGLLKHDIGQEILAQSPGGR